MIVDGDGKATDNLEDKPHIESEAWVEPPRHREANEAVHEESEGDGDERHHVETGASILA